MFNKNSMDPSESIISCPYTNELSYESLRAKREYLLCYNIGGKTDYLISYAVA